MKEFYIEVDEDKCYLDKPVFDSNGDAIGYRRTVVMTKDAFIECYNKWIKGKESKEWKQMRKANCKQNKSGR